MQDYGPVLLRVEYVKHDCDCDKCQYNGTDKGGGWAVRATLPRGPVHLGGFPVSGTAFGDDLRKTARSAAAALYRDVWLRFRAAATKKATEEWEAEHPMPK